MTSGNDQTGRDSGTRFEGHIDRDCGEHRTVGPHRAWCYDCGEWCYPDAPCARCEVPQLRMEADTLRWLHAEAVWQRDEALELAEEAIPYAGEYFDQKWGLSAQLAELRALTGEAT
jgi:hypothetical protein